MVYQKIEPNLWKPENVEDMIEGILLSKDPSQKYPETKVYGIETSDKKQWTFFGTTVLDDRLQYAKIGDKVKIVYKGTVMNKKKQSTKMFEVFIDDGKPEVVKINP